MRKDIEVLLLEDVAGLGEAGEIVRVSEGYARNKLFPSGLAAVATAEARRQQEAQLHEKAQVAESELKRLQEQAGALDGTELMLRAKVKEGNEIFGSVTSSMIAKELESQTKMPFQPKQIELGKPLTATGSYPVTLRFSPDVEATIQVTVTPEDSSSSASEPEEE